MNEINKALGLKADATEADAVAAIGKLKEQLTAARKYKGVALSKELQELVDAKRASGLPFEQALEVAQRQLENDRQKNAKGE